MKKPNSLNLKPLNPSSAVEVLGFGLPELPGGLFFEDDIKP